MASNPTPAAPAPKVGDRCPNGHEYAQRSEADPIKGQVMVVFCPACESIVPAEPPTDGR
jgi:hypothetical protein